MSAPELAPRRTIGGVVAVWVVAVLAGVAIGVFAPPETRSVWTTLALAGCIVLAFAVQLAYGRSHQFIERMALSVLGALVVLGVITLGFALASLVAVTGAGTPG